MKATNHNDHLGETYPAMLNELICIFGVSISRFHCCGRHGHGLWPSWYRPELNHHGRNSKELSYPLSHDHAILTSEHIRDTVRFTRIL